MPPTLTFLAWVRERVGELVGGIEHGRARAATDVTLTGRTAAGAVTSTQTRQVKFLLAGPQDVTELKPRAISGRYPAPGAIDARSDNCPTSSCATRPCRGATRPPRTRRPVPARCTPGWCWSWASTGRS